MGHKQHSSVRSIPLHRIAVVRSFAQLLTDIGAPVEREFQRAGLPYYALDNVNDYVPSHRFWAFVTNASRHEGIEDFGFRVGQMLGGNGIDAKLTILMRQSPTLFRGLSTYITICNQTVTTSRMELVCPPQSGYTYFTHRPSCDIRNPAVEQLSWFGIMTTTAAIREFAGPEWIPKEIGVMTRQRLCPSIQEAFPDTRIRLSERYSYIALDNALLSLPPLAAEGAECPPSSSDFVPCSSRFPESLTQLLTTYALEKQLSIEFASELCNLSKRTLQRRLRESNTCYSTLLDQARINVARRMLKDRSIKVIDIARLLGYSDASNFGRAFRRVTGVNPRTYRKALEQGMNA
jgi:AraC-like DNA-binding protein